MVFPDLIKKKICKYLYPDQSFYDFLENELSMNMTRLIDELDDDIVTITEIDLCKILPECELILDNDNWDKYVHKGVECEVLLNRLYRYKSFYIVIYAEYYGIEECDFLCDKEVIVELFQDYIEVIHEVNFDSNEFLENEIVIAGEKLGNIGGAYYKLADEKAFINQITKWYRRAYGENGWAIKN